MALTEWMGWMRCHLASRILLPLTILQFRMRQYAVRETSIEDSYSMTSLAGGVIVRSQ